MAKDKAKIEKEYFSYKEDMAKILSDVTLRRWKVLTKAYKAGKKIWGSRFSIQKLSMDMDLPYTTTKRCLSLDRCNKRTWKLIGEDKISVFKVAQICMSKNRTYQDEIVDMVIVDNLSTHAICSLKINDLKDVNKERMRLASENGYSRKGSAFRSFDTWIQRGKLLMSMDRKFFPENKQSEINKDLKNLNKIIERYLE